MSLSKGVEIQTLSSVKAGFIQFYTPQASHETMLVQIPPNTLDDMFVHKYQTDQLMVVRGKFILVILHDGKYQYIHLNDREPKVVTIPPRIPHSAINLNDEPCMLINAVIRHGRAHPDDYRPLKLPFPYDFDRVDRLSLDKECQIAA